MAMYIKNACRFRESLREICMSCFYGLRNSERLLCANKQKQSIVKLCASFIFFYFYFLLTLQSYALWSERSILCFTDSCRLFFCRCVIFMAKYVSRYSLFTPWCAVLSILEGKLYALIGLRSCAFPREYSSHRNMSSEPLQMLLQCISGNISFFWRMEATACAEACCIWAS